MDELEIKCAYKVYKDNCSRWCYLKMSTVQESHVRFILKETIL